MQLSINIEDSYLQEQIANYISQKHIQANDFIVEVLKHFFDKNNSVLHYKTQNPEKASTTIDFGLESQKDYKLFEDVKDVKSYAKELRDNAWK
ncbi:MAG TPA: hypothetical protein ENK88_05670 [Campylobacterales bacterium]|nr:hypothetical protein [Campylobacterales bacterium]HHD81108.1 hypothetical protein [Campylobacterales bacterium]